MEITKLINVFFLAFSLLVFPTSEQGKWERVIVVTLSNGGVSASNPQVNVETELIFQISSSPIL